VLLSAAEFGKPYLKLFVDHILRSLTGPVRFCAVTGSASSQTVGKRSNSTKILSKLAFYSDTIFFTEVTPFSVQNMLLMSVVICRVARSSKERRHTLVSFTVWLYFLRFDLL
jgi:hypothetical protein